MVVEREAESAVVFKLVCCSCGAALVFTFVLVLLFAYCVIVLLWMVLLFVSTDGVLLCSKDGEVQAPGSLKVGLEVLVAKNLGL